LVEGALNKRLKEKKVAGLDEIDEEGDAQADEELDDPEEMKLEKADLVASISTSIQSANTRRN
jgi:hypothetical protein